MDLRQMEALFEEVRLELAERELTNHKVIAEDFAIAQQFATSFKAVVESRNHVVKTISRDAIDLKAIDTSLKFAPLTDYYVELIDQDQAIFRAFGYTFDGGVMKKATIKIVTTITDADEASYGYSPGLAQFSLRPETEIAEFYKTLIEVELEPIPSQG
jgi:hypothetical protein